MDSSPQNCSLPFRICWAIFLWPLYDQEMFFVNAQNGQVSKFNKYGHVVYHLICILKLINKKSIKYIQK